jgi:hypothetical protein
MYIGDNGIMESSIKIPGATNVIERVHLIADEGKFLWNGVSKKKIVITSKEDIKNWKEVYSV